MVSRIWNWLNDRWPVSTLIKLALEEEIPGGSRFAYTLGSAIIVVLLLQGATGIMQLLFYVPTVDHAYDSIGYLRTEVPFGWLIHGLHYWGANAMVILVAAHMARVFLWGAYKSPRELTWLIGTVQLIVVMALSMTGTSLIWDQRGYWSTEVGTGIGASVPVFGDITKYLLRGGDVTGQLTLSRFFVGHVFLLPGALLVLIGTHLVALRRFGTVGGWKAPKVKSEPFWPDQVFKDAVAGSIVFFLLVALTVFAQPLFSGPADPLDTAYVPKAEWNFLFLYESLKYFPGKFEPVGAAGVPGVFILLLLLLPFIDRNPQRNPFRRPVAMLCALVYSGTILGFSIAGYLSPGYAMAPASPMTSDVSSSSQVPAVSRSAIVPGAEKEVRKGAAALIGSAQHGGVLYKKHCISCHGLEGTGNIPNPGSDEGKVPPLNPIGRDLFSASAKVFVANIDRFLQHGSVPKGPSPALSMPAFGDTHSLTQQQIANIEAYILHLNGVDRAQLINPGMVPRKFFLLTLMVYALVALWLGGLWSKRRGRTG